MALPNSGDENQRTYKRNMKVVKELPRTHKINLALVTNACQQ